MQSVAADAVWPYLPETDDAIIDAGEFPLAGYKQRTKAA